MKCGFKELLNKLRRSTRKHLLCKDIFCFNLMHHTRHTLFVLGDSSRVHFVGASSQFDVVIGSIRDFKSVRNVLVRHGFNF